VSTHTQYWHAVIGVLIMVLVIVGNNGIAGLERQWQRWRDEREFRSKRNLKSQRDKGTFS
jgi:hypothetical protein